MSKWRYNTNSGGHHITTRTQWQDEWHSAVAKPKSHPNRKPIAHILPTSAPKGLFPLASAVMIRHNGDESPFVVKKSSTYPSPMRINTQREIPWYVKEYKKSKSMPNITNRPSSASAPRSPKIAQSNRAFKSAMMRASMRTPGILGHTSSEQPFAQQRASTDILSPRIDTNSPQHDNTLPRQQTPKFNPQRVIHDNTLPRPENVERVMAPVRPPSGRRTSTTPTPLPLAALKQCVSDKHGDEEKQPDTILSPTSKEFWPCAQEPESIESLSPWDDDDFQDEAHTQAYIYEIWGLNAPVLGNDDSEEEVADTTSDEASAETKLARVSAPARASSPPLRNRAGHTRSSSEPVRAAKTPLTLPRSRSVSKRSSGKRNSGKKNKRRSVIKSRRKSLRTSSGRSLSKTKKLPSRHLSISKLPRA